MTRVLFTLVVLQFFSAKISAEDGYRLWLRYDVVQDVQLRQRYAESIRGWFISGDSPTLSVARQELRAGMVAHAFLLRVDGHHPGVLSDRLRVLAVD